MVTERARGQALQDLMQERSRQRPRLIDPEAETKMESVPVDEPLPMRQPNLDFANSPMQIAVSIPVSSNNVIVQAVSEINST